MSCKMDVILLCCGSFNPITNMHLRMFEIARDYLIKSNLNVLGGIISPVHDSYPTSKKLAAAGHRCEMIRRSLVALRGQPHWVRLDTWEVEQSGWLRTRQVLQHHLERVNPNADDFKVKMMILCGSDLFETFNVPNLWSDEDIEFFCKNGMIVIGRQGTDAWQTLEKSDKSQILLKYKENIHIVCDKIINSISSTAIREMISKEESIRYLLPDPVIEYIIDNNLYK